VGRVGTLTMASWAQQAKALHLKIAGLKTIVVHVRIEQLTESFLRAKSLGYTAAKSGFVAVPNDLVVPSFAVREGIWRFEAVRTAVGDDFDICIDAHGKLTTMAVEFCTGIEHLHPFFVEKAT
jgi:galactonate dehydratase